MHPQHSTDLGDAWLIRRFWAKVDTSGGPAACWLWTGALSSGYGRLARTGQGNGYVYAHQFSYLLARGSYPAHLFVCHDCPSGDNPTCVNPAHLFLGTQTDNMRDASRKGRARNGALTQPGRIARGSQKHMSDLTDEKVRAIRRRVAAGEMQKDVAVAFGVSRPTLCEIVARKTWRHVT